MMPIVPTFDLSRIIGLAKQAAMLVAMWVLFRAFIMGVITLVLPVILYKGWLIVNEQVFAEIASVGATGVNSVVVQFTGMGAWVANHLRLPECIAVMLSGASAQFLLRMLGR